MPTLSRLPLPIRLSSGRLRRAIEVLLVVALAVQLARLAWLALAPMGPIGAPAPTASTETARLRVDLLFGESPQAGASLEGYSLHGVRMDKRGGGAAIIAGPDKVQGAYRVGDALAAGIVLDHVAAEHVLVRMGSQRRRLEMATDAPSAAAQTPATTLASAPAVPAAAPVASNAAVDPSRLLTEAGLRLNTQDGEPNGYTVMPRGNDALLRQAGLQPGDVLTSVNGLSLNAEHLQEVQQQLRTGGGEARITFQRDGQSRVLTLKAP